MIIRDTRPSVLALRRQSAALTVMLVLLLAVTLVAGCRQLYEGFKAQSIESCYQLSYPDQQQCLEEHDVSYDQYQQDKQAGKTGQ